MTRKLLSTVVFAWMLCGCRLVLGQFSGSLQGHVEDPSGASIPKATVTLTNSATNVTQTTQASDSGVYRFDSLAPGNYVVTGSATGFASTKTTFTLSTGQLMNVPLPLRLASSTQTVEVTAQAPVLDTAETRNQLTIDTQALESLPLPGRNQLGLVTLAPGVTGIGIQGSGGNGQSNDNYASATGCAARS